MFSKYKKSKSIDNSVITPEKSTVMPLLLSSTATSNSSSLPTNIVSTHQPRVQKPLSVNANNGGVRRRFIDFIRFTTSRPSSTAHRSFFRTNSSKKSKQQLQNTSNVSTHDNISVRSSSFILNDEANNKLRSLPTDNLHTQSIVDDENSLNGIHTCTLCCQDYPSDQFERLQLCFHSYCRECLRSYLKLEITEGRTTLACPQKDCSEHMHPDDISRILKDQPDLIEKYENFMVRRVLQSIVDTRWCPSPDCGFAVIAAGCASCPKIRCLRPGCNTWFCYHCKSVWHPNQTCENAARGKSSNLFANSPNSLSLDVSQEEMKNCPRCQAPILKMNDGSCNHMTCSICQTQFCWLCGREISDLHYLSPSGCTFWGKKQWSRKKVILWQVATLIGAPIIITLIAGVSIPSIIIGIPVWAGRKLFRRYSRSNCSKIKRSILVTLGVLGSVIVSPIIAALAVAIGVPILLAYAYGVIPISLCRTGGCGLGVRNETSDEDIEYNDNALTNNMIEIPTTHSNHIDNQSITTHPTIGGDSSSLSNSITYLVDERSNTSTKALASTITVSFNDSIGTFYRNEIQADAHDYRGCDIESINVSEKSSKLKNDITTFAGSIKDACTVSCKEYNTNRKTSDFQRRSSQLSNTSDCMNRLQNEQNISVLNRTNSPHIDRMVSFSDKYATYQSKCTSDHH